MTGTVSPLPPEAPDGSWGALPRPNFPAASAPPRGRRFAGALWDNLFAGFLVVIPLMITVWLVKFVWETFEDPVQNLARFILSLAGERPPGQAVPVWYRTLQYLSAPGVALLITLLCIGLIGLTVRTFFGGWLLRRGEALLERIPGVRTIYKATKELLRSLAGGGPAQGKKSVVLAPWIGKQGQCLGFVTGKGDERIVGPGGEPLFFVFVPTTPNPTSGYLLLLPEKDFVRLSMTTEEAARLIISGGLASAQPEEPPGK